MKPADAVPRLVATLPGLPFRPRDAHKGSFGHVLVVAGSRGMSGAAILCGSGALRGGAGLVRVAAPEGISPIVAAGNSCYMTAPLPEDAQGRFAAAALSSLLELAQDSTVIAAGPGLGQGEGTTAIIKGLLAQTTLPLILDADGLNVLGGDTSSLRNRAGPLVLTPHPGEFSRLAGCATSAVQADREDRSVRFAAENGVVLVLKGQGTIVTDGTRLYVNSTGNPGMATGGTGDVLTGLIAALLAQRLEAFAAAQLGVFLHGRAGDLAAGDLGEVSLIATDLLDYLPMAFSS